VLLVGPTGIRVYLYSMGASTAYDGMTPTYTVIIIDSNSKFQMLLNTILSGVSYLAVIGGQATNTSHIPSFECPKTGSALTCEHSIAR